MLRKLSLCLSCLLLALGMVHLPARAAEEAAVASQGLRDHETFARDFATKVLAIIQDAKKSYGDRKDVLRTAFAKSVDIDWIARFVLGKAWSGASDDQKTRYAALYRTYLTETYVANFAENPDKRIRDIKILGISDSHDDTFTVRTEMMLADFENVNVNYLVREKEGKYKVLDIAIENVSLIATHRAEFTNLAAAHGIDGVISRLEQLVKNGADSITLSMNTAH